MNAAAWSAVITTAGLIAIALITNHQNKRGAKATNELASRVVDREDFEAYTERQDQERQRLERRISDLEQRLEAEVTARERAEKRADQAEKAAAQAKRRTAELERRVSTLEAENADLRDRLAVATRLLDQKYPDE